MSEIWQSCNEHHNPMSSSFQTRPLGACLTQLESLDCTLLSAFLGIFVTRASTPTSSTRSISRSCTCSINTCAGMGNQAAVWKASKVRLLRLQHSRLWSHTTISNSFMTVIFFAQHNSNVKREKKHSRNSWILLLPPCMRPQPERLCFSANAYNMQPCPQRIESIVTLIIGNL